MRLPEDIEKRLKHLAFKTGRTKSFYVREAILEHLEGLEETYNKDLKKENIMKKEYPTDPNYLITLSELTLLTKMSRTYWYKANLPREKKTFGSGFCYKWKNVEDYINKATKSTPKILKLKIKLNKSKIRENKDYTNNTERDEKRLKEAMFYWRGLELPKQKIIDSPQPPLTFFQALKKLLKGK